MSAVVGVVVAAYNGGRYLAETLASIRAQTYPHWVCVVVDDGSTDDTAALAATVAASDARITVLRQPNAGVSAARNAGVAALPADATLLAFLDADDTWLPDALTVLVAALEDRDDAVGVFGLAEYMDSAGRAVFPGVHPANQLDRRRMGRLDLPRSSRTPRRRSTCSRRLPAGRRAGGLVPAS